MDQEQKHVAPPSYETATKVEGEHQDHKLLDFLDKKEEEKPQDEMSVPEFVETHVAKVEENKEEEESKPGFKETLPRSTNSSGPISDEENAEGEKSLTEKIKEKVTGDKEAVPHLEETEDNKNFMEKIKEKMPGKKADAAPVEYPPTETKVSQNEVKEHKGIMEKIKEKVPGHQKGEQEKEIQNGITH
ncbi:hypothetical protein IFM89_009391 [Coptis chinensis]|uniref:Dehydrin n=1 Tax=Coptis chinensis TaxID=261450 RepID=A0A835LV00_9MAGN|nr:hypothetical protein IFM89_009391 [Coptis chinensis]